jgi:hypothetical protein
MIVMDSSLKRLDTVKKFRDMMMEELVQFIHFRLDSMFSESILNCVIMFVKPKDNIDPLTFTVELMKDAWTLTPEEIDIVTMQLQTAVRSKRTISYPRLYRFMQRIYRLIYPFAKDIIKSQLKK